MSASEKLSTAPFSLPRKSGTKRELSPYDPYKRKARGIIPVLLALVYPRVSAGARTRSGTCIARGPSSGQSARRLRRCTTRDAIRRSTDKGGKTPATSGSGRTSHTRPATRRRFRSCAAGRSRSTGPAPFQSRCRNCRRFSVGSSRTTARAQHRPLEAARKPSDGRQVKLRVKSETEGRIRRPAGSLCEAKSL